MAKKPVVLIDINILLDVLQKREPFYETISRSPGSCRDREGARASVAAHSLTTLFLPDPERQVLCRSPGDDHESACSS